MSYKICKNITVAYSVCLLQFYENSHRLRQFYNAAILYFMFFFYSWGVPEWSAEKSREGIMTGQNIENRDFLLSVVYAN